jgi:hypothetical protein
MIILGEMVAPTDYVSGVCWHDDNNPKYSARTDYAWQTTGAGSAGFSGIDDQDTFMDPKIEMSVLS